MAERYFSDRERQDVLERADAAGRDAERDASRKGRLLAAPGAPIHARRVAELANEDCRGTPIERHMMDDHLEQMVVRIHSHQQTPQHISTEEIKR